MSKKTKQKKRILHIGPMPPAIGGMQTYFAGLLDSGISEAFDIKALKSDFLGKLSCTGFKRIIVNMLNAMVVSIALLVSIISFRPAVVHIQTNSGLGFFEKSFYSFLARLFFRKVIIHVHGGGFREFYQRASSFKRRLIRFYIAVSSYILVASPQMRETFIMIGVAPEKITLIGNAIVVPEKSIWDEKDIKNNQVCVKILFLNRVTFEKGISELLQAANRICGEYPQAVFQIVGPESSDCDTFKKEVAASVAADQFEFLGKVTEEEKEQVFVAADIYVLPSHVEDMPYGLLEAMAYGLPCIVSAVGGIPSLIIDGDSGLLIPPKDVEALEKGLRTLISDVSMRVRIGKAARDRIETGYSWKMRSREFIDFYDSIM